jgi:hypothetical protein
LVCSSIFSFEIYCNHQLTNLSENSINKKKIVDPKHPALDHGLGSRKLLQSVLDDVLLKAKPKVQKLTKENKSTFFILLFLLLLTTKISSLMN